MSSHRRFRGAAVLLTAAFLSACASLPPRAPLDPARDAQDFAARRLGWRPADLPPPAAGWNREAWFRAALALNPQLAEARAAARAAAAAGERTAAERPNPSLNLFGEYVSAASASAAWLYGLSLEFLLPRAR